MNQFDGDQFDGHQFDGGANQGRKGIAYDWQSLYASAQASGIDHELSTLTPEYAE